jgi:tRNA-dihydrouridine synthase
MSELDFWKHLNPGAFALAPMEDVTDTVFREIIMSVSAPDKLHLLFTEFTSVDGLCHPKGRLTVSHRLRVNQTERDLLDNNNIKLIAQIWGNDPDKFYKSSRFIAEEFCFDGIDINMGCPVGKVIKQNTCSALINQPELALEIIQATIEGSGLPVSVKTRTGVKVHETVRWIGQLLHSKISAITIHARTQKMQSLFPADWNQITLAVNLRDSLNSDIKILGNGDVSSYDHGLHLIDQTGADGVMVGRGIFSDPWFFSVNSSERSITEKMDLLRKHIDLFYNTWGSSRNFSILKRFYKIYLTAFEGAAILRSSLIETYNISDALKVIDRFRNDFLSAA